MNKSTDTNLILNSFIEFLKQNGYSHISEPFNTRYADMYLAYKAGLNSNIN